jgi:hypothetical protein
MAVDLAMELGSWRLGEQKLLGLLCCAQNSPHVHVWYAAAASGALLLGADCADKEASKGRTISRMFGQDLMMRVKA